MFKKIIVLVFVIFLCLFKSEVYGYNYYSDIVIPNSCWGLFFSAGDYMTTISAEHKIFIFLATLDADLNIYEGSIGIFYDSSLLRIDLFYSRYFLMDFEYKLDSGLSEYKSSFAFPNFYANEGGISLYLHLFKFSLLRFSPGLTFSVIKMNISSIEWKNKTNSYDYLVYDAFQSKDFQDYIANNYLYDFYFNMLISLYAPSSKNSGLILNLNYGIGIAIPYAIDLMIKRQSFYKDIDKFSVFSSKIQLQLSFYFGIN